MDKCFLCDCDCGHEGGDCQNVPKIVKLGTQQIPQFAFREIFKYAGIEQFQACIVCSDCGNLHSKEETFYRPLCQPCMRKHATHPQLETKAGFAVDEQLLDIINWLIDHNCETSNSCQMNINENAWISFCSINEVSRFMLLLRHTDLYEYMETQEWTLGFPDIDEEDDDYSGEYAEERYESEIGVSLRFPAKDIPYVTSELHKIQKEEEGHNDDTEEEESENILKRKEMDSAMESNSSPNKKRKAIL